jgi:hypothetical protein
MAKEYLVVSFPRSRRIMINSQFMGTTNTKLELEGGPYVVTLGPPNNFTPDKLDIDLCGTSSQAPMMIEFQEAPK